MEAGAVTDPLRRPSIFFSRRGFCGCVKMKHHIKDISPDSRGVGRAKAGRGSFFADMEDQVKKKKKNFQHLRCDDNRVTRLFCFVLCPSLESDQL